MTKSILILALITLPAAAQFTPPPGGAYNFAGGTWSPFAAAGTTGAVSFTPTPIGLYCFNAGTGQWVPWTTANCGGSGGSGTVTSVGVTTANGVSGTVANPTTTPAITITLGAITPTTVLATGNVDGTTPVTITTGTTATLNAFLSGLWVNQEATAATAVTYTLPTAAAGQTKCIVNGWNGAAATTGVLTLATSASGQFIIFTDGTLSATGGNVTSAGAAADKACVVGIDATHWMLYTQSGVWTKH